MSIKVGFEGLLYYGTAGSTASTQLTDVRDVNFNYDHSRAPTTVRGDGSAAPIKHERVVERVVSMDFTMTINSSGAGNTAYTTLMGHVANGTAVALRGKDYSTGKGPDFDATLTAKLGQPLGGEQTVQFTATPTDEGGRSAQLYV